MINSILNTSGYPYKDNWYDLPFVCDVCDKKIVDLEKCPLCEDKDDFRYICETDCIHFQIY